VPVLKQLIDHYSEPSQALLGVQRVPDQDVSKYGIIDPGPLTPPSSVTDAHPVVLPVRNIVEKPAVDQAPSALAVLGRYILPSAVFECIEKTPLGHGGELQLTDAIGRLAVDGSVKAFMFEGIRHDIGNLEGWLGANLSFALADDHLSDSIRSFLDTHSVHPPRNVAFR
jgi:UTP--glucose-1-phosphate uridylyltransferase